MSDQPDFKQLFEESPDVLLVLLPDAPRYTMVAATRSRWHITHTTPATLGRGLFEVFPDNPDDPTASGTSNLRASLERVLRTRQPDTMPVQKYDIRGPDGTFQSRYWSPKNLPILSPSGEVRYILHRVEDVTELVRATEHDAELRDQTRAAEREVIRRSEELARTLRELREANSRLAELDRVKTEFFSNVSHEFRTPLTLMLGPLEDELAERIAQPPARRVRIETAYRNALRLLKLVNSLLDFSRVEAGRAQATYTPTDLALLTRELASMFRSATDKAELELLVECPDLPQPVYVDREMWEQIVFNLISNAFKHTFEGSIRVALAWRGEYVELTVADTGVGIPEAELPRLFERFQRVKGTRSRSHEGTGIGLALVQELAALHGGGITVASTARQGTTFTVTVRTGKAHLSADKIAAAPAAAPGPSARATGAAYIEEALHWTADESPPAPQRDRTPRAATEGGPTAGVESAGEKPRRPRILLADDNADMRHYITDLLGPYYEVTAVPDGETALEAVRDTAPDLVLSDIMMPRLDGLGLLKALRAGEATRRLPIILLSARAGEEASVGAMDAGADDYLVKPFTARELIARVRAHMELARQRHSFERELERANQELRTVNRELDAFTRTVSHDLRTPLGGMIGFADFLLSGNPGPLNEKQREYLQDILQSGRRLSRLTEDLLRFAAAAHRPLTREKVAVGALVHTIVDELQATQPDRPMTVRIGALPDANADPTLLRQVFANLIGNAFKFTRDRSPARVDIDGHSDATTCTYCVRDNGVGFDMRDVDRLFTSFERAQDAEHFEGTGLGLSIVLDVIERHGGRISAVGRPGEGAEFTFSLPR